ncbi:hypothetical protein [Flavivirga spongiicola]|uniref:Uncharacterized protein n=1 Tax=Flavivirga spongiicola TaxID=421621 RepID=A0ABU7XT97_9FLAO|nr:hypothetical protein [Flavivirga sp. MEBiC05379]MDO5978986.1 hypothetical protein [Flavivirga sp. MEBiC05379]
MDFFTNQDFEYYSSVIGVTYKSGTAQAQELKTKLTKNGVFDKIDSLIWRHLYTKGYKKQ